MLFEYFGFNTVMKSLAVFGLIVSGFLTLVVLVFVRPPLITQRNQRTGETRHGLFRWFAAFAAIFAGIPLALILVRASVVPALWVTEHWLPISASVLGVAAVWGGLVWWVNHPRVPEPPAQIIPLPQPRQHNPAPSIAAVPPQGMEDTAVLYSGNPWGPPSDSAPRG